MKKHPYLFAVITICCIFAIGFAFFYQSYCKASSSTLKSAITTPAAKLLQTEMAKSNDIMKKFMKTPQALPFTFALNDKQIRGIPTSWKPKTTDHQLVPNNDVDAFANYVGLAPLFSGNVNVSNDKFDFASSLELKKLWEQISSFLIDGDYYLLGKNTRKSDIWNVRQFDMPSKGEGIFELFRNIVNKEESFIIHPKGSIKSDCKYELSNLTDGSKALITGEEWLKNGFKVLLGRREACIIKYSIIK
jgi:hypothetical protein